MNNLHYQLNDHPLHRSIYDLCVEIEKLPPSEHATKLVTMAGALQQPVASLRADLAALREDRAKLATAAYEVLNSYILELQVRGHPCPQNMVRCSELRAAIDAARGEAKS